MYYDTFRMIDGDIYINQRTHDMEIVNGQEELRQNIENRLSVNKNEWFLNTELGLAYANIEGKGVTNADIDFAIRECVSEDDRIKSSELVSVERNQNRQAIINIVLTDISDNIMEFGGVKLG